MKFAFIGFGEAGPQIARGLMSAGAGSVTAYDILALDPTTREDWFMKAASFGARPVDTAEAAVAALKPPKPALKAADGGAVESVAICCCSSCGDRAPRTRRS